MATPVGTNAVNSLSRRVFHPQLIDNVYLGNTVWFRLYKLGKKLSEGGTQIEVASFYSTPSAGGSYSGFDLLDVTPYDTIKNMAFDWKQSYSYVTIDGLSLTRADHPEALANLLAGLFEQAEMDLKDKLGTQTWSDASTNLKNIDGLKGAVDDGTVASTYGGLTRSSNVWTKSQIDSATTTLTLTAMRTMMGNCTIGGQHPTVIPTTQANYNRYWVLLQANQAFPVQPSLQDEQLAQGGFNNLLFDGAPVVVDPKVPVNHMFFLNERFLWLYVKTGVDFKMNDFIEPPNQDAYVSKILWYGNLVCTSPRVQGKITALTA